MHLLKIWLDIPQTSPHGSHTRTLNHWQSFVGWPALAKHQRSQAYLHNTGCACISVHVDTTFKI